MSTIHLLKRFDRCQLWRLFVDGRFQKKYGGWVGYEAGERGSVQAWLNAFAYMLDHFDLSRGLRATYLRELHKRAMLSVETTNLKSSPGDIRYLNSGMPFFAKSTTYEHLVEVFEMRRGDGTALFNSRRFEKPADELDLDEVYAYMMSEGRINYRNWYPNLDRAQREAIEGKRSLHEFYEAKHAVQMMFVARMEAIVERYNRAIRVAENDAQRLRAIALVPRELELLHPFPDGNSRTFSCITLTHLLLWNGFPPALLENPNLDNEVSLEQWIEEVRQGMARFEGQLAEPERRLFGYAIGEMAAADRERFLEMAAGVSERLERHREIYLTPERLARYTGGRWLGGAVDPNLRFTGVGTYRTYREGNVYFAMAIPDWIKEGKEPREELRRIIAKGMRALVVDDPRCAEGLELPVLLVDDAFQAFKRSAVEVRREKDPYTVLVTGTEGKTGAKVQLHHLLNRQVAAHAVLNSANTEVPVLRSLINLDDEEAVEINEVSVGSDEAYRVERSMMVSPNLCFFTNIGPNHMDMHKSIENVVIAKSSVVEGLREGGKCIVNATIEQLPRLLREIDRRRPGTRILTYGVRNLDNATLLNSAFDPPRLGWRVQARIDGEEVDYFLPLFQNHAPLTSVGILLAVKEMGYDVRRAAEDYAGLQPFETMGRMLKLHKRSGDVLFYDQSRRGAIEGMRSAFADMKNFRVEGKTVALVGGVSIKKDGDWTRRAHAELAELINHSGIDRLYTTGNYMDYVTERLDDRSIFVNHSDDLDELAASLFDEIQGGDLLFIIGSAYLYLGRVADRLMKMKDRGRFDFAIYDHPLPGGQLERYRALVALAEIDDGLPAERALLRNELPAGRLERFVTRYGEFDEARAVLLMEFFSGLNRRTVERVPFVNVNQAVAEGGKGGYVYSPLHCERWFNNLRKGTERPRKQLFGSFYEFGDPEYLLHVEVATTNLHAGLVRWRRKGTAIELVKMDEADHAEIADRYGERLGKELRLQPRSWGVGWCSHDAGGFIDVTRARIFTSMVDPRGGPFVREVWEPLLEALRRGRDGETR